MSNIKVPYQVVIWGDSISQYGDKLNGWISWLRDEYQGKAFFHNLGISGLNSQQYLDMVKAQSFDKLMPKTVDKIFIGLGANDAAYKVESVQRQGVPLEDFRQNMVQLIAEAQKYTKNITLICPPPVYQFQGRNEEVTVQYAKAVQEIAAANNIHAINMRDFKCEFKALLVDGLHLNDLGNEVLYKLAAEDIGEIDFWRDHWSVWKMAQ